LRTTAKCIRRWLIHGPEQELSILFDIILMDQQSWKVCPFETNFVLKSVLFWDKYCLEKVLKSVLFWYKYCLEKCALLIQIYKIYMSEVRFNYRPRHGHEIYQSHRTTNFIQSTRWSHSCSECDYAQDTIIYTVNDFDSLYATKTI